MSNCKPLAEKEPKKEKQQTEDDVENKRHSMEKKPLRENEQ